MSSARLERSPEHRPAGLRLVPPTPSGPSLRAVMVWQLAGLANPPLPAGMAGPLGREHARRVITRLGELHRQATRTEPEAEPEAGA